MQLGFNKWSVLGTRGSFEFWNLQYVHQSLLSGKIKENEIPHDATPLKMYECQDIKTRKKKQNISQKDALYTLLKI